jgi:hypothetical protein
MTINPGDRRDLLADLAAVRPDRYTAGDISWASDVIDDYADSMSVAEAKTRAAVDEVKNLEANATRKANRLLRHYGTNGELPLGWFEMARWPVSVGDFRVCLEEMTPEDFREFARNEEVAANSDHSARLAAVKGARDLADIIEAAHLDTFGEWGTAVNP